MSKTIAVISSEITNAAKEKLRFSTVLADYFRTFYPEALAVFASIINRRYSRDLNDADIMDIHASKYNLDQPTREAQAKISTVLKDGDLYPYHTPQAIIIGQIFHLNLDQIVQQLQQKLNNKDTALFSLAVFKELINTTKVWLQAMAVETLYIMNEATANKLQNQLSTTNKQAEDLVAQKFDLDKKTIAHPLAEKALSELKVDEMTTAEWEKALEELPERRRSTRTISPEAKRIMGSHLDN